MGVHTLSRCTRLIDEATERDYAGAGRCFLALVQSPWTARSRSPLLFGVWRVPILLSVAVHMIQRIFCGYLPLLHPRAFEASFPSTTHFLASVIFPPGSHDPLSSFWHLIAGVRA